MASTVDVNEISHFGELGRMWWDEKGATIGLHAMNKLRVPRVRDGLINTGTVKKELVGTSEPLKGLLILDVGCGGGILTEPLAKLACTITGIDPCADLIEVAKQHAALDPSLSNIEYLPETVEEHAGKNFEKYDAVVASEVLDHVNERKLFLEACVKCLKPGGSIFVTTINKTMASWLIGIIFYENVLGFIPRGTHHWDKFISPEDTQKILEEYNCQTRAVSGSVYNFINQTWYESSFKSIFYALHAVKC